MRTYSIAQGTSLNALSDHIIFSSQSSFPVKLSSTHGTIFSFPGGSDNKKSACCAGDLDSIPGSGRSPGEGHGNPLQYSCLENPWTDEPGRVHSMEVQRVGHY